MQNKYLSSSTVLSVAFTSRGFGYGVFSSAHSLITWGVAEVRVPANKTKGSKKSAQLKNRECLKRLSTLIEQYRPTHLLIPDDQGRSKRVKVLIGQATALATERGVRTKQFSRSQVVQHFAPATASTKHQIATAIAEHLHELKTFLPPKRLPWNSENRNQSIFDAASYAFLHFARDPVPVRKGEH